MFNTKLKQRVESLEFITTNHMNTLLVFEQKFSDLVYLHKQNQILRVQSDDLKKKIETLNNRFEDLLKKIESKPKKK